MPQGRSPKPLRVHHLEGTFRDSVHGKPSKAMVSADGEVGPPPKHLDTAGRNLWEFVSRHQHDYLAGSDRIGLQMLCEVWGLRAKALAALGVDLMDKPTRTASCESATHALLLKRLLERFSMALQRKRLQADAVRKQIEIRFDPAGVRERLLARRHTA